MSKIEIMARKPKEGHKFIYRYFDEGGSYIGQTRKSLKDRAGKDGKNYLEKDSKWAKAITEKGFANFNVEILDECLEKDANKKEKEFIKQFNSRKEGYNSTFGGKCYNPDWEYGHDCEDLTVKEVEELILEEDLGLTKQQIRNFFDNPLKIEIPEMCYYNSPDKDTFLLNWKFIKGCYYPMYLVPGSSALEYEAHDYSLYEKDDTLLIVHGGYDTDDGTYYHFTCFYK